MTKDCEKAIDKLARYEDAEEQGRLIVLPCDVGDTVYYIRGAYYGSPRKTVEAIRVTEISMKENRSRKILPPSIIANRTRYQFASIGKTVFLSREEAEKALEGKT